MSEVILSSRSERKTRTGNEGEEKIIKKKRENQRWIRVLVLRGWMRRSNENKQLTSEWLVRHGVKIREIYIYRTQLRSRDGYAIRHSVRFFRRGGSVLSGFDEFHGFSLGFQDIYINRGITISRDWDFLQLPSCLVPFASHAYDIRIRNRGVCIDLLSFIFNFTLLAPYRFINAASALSSRPPTLLQLRSHVCGLMGFLKTVPSEARTDFRVPQSR